MAKASGYGVDLIETDVRSSQGRLEVRHSKTMGPVPLLWDRWSLERGWRPRLVLEDVLRDLDRSSELMLDLKGGGTAFAINVRTAMRERAFGVEYTVCSQFWDLLEPFRDEAGVRVVHSVGNARMVLDVTGRLNWYDRHAISIHQRLLTPAVVKRLLGYAPLLMTWPVNDDVTMDRLQSWGVNGFISDNLAMLARRAIRQGMGKDAAAEARPEAGGNPP
jgi:glycerophosphoryl diester phosphodiesterase